MRFTIHILSLLLLLGLSGCSKKHAPDPPVAIERTVFVYMPWSSDLDAHFKQNLEDLKVSITNNRIQADRFIVFFSETPTKAKLFELKYDKEGCETVPLKEYTSPAFTTTEGIKNILQDVVFYAAAPKYSLIVGSHGMGWIPVSSWWGRSEGTKFYWDYGNETRFFGGHTAEYQTDVSTFVDAINQAGIRFEYILFDDCYMSCIEVAYDLRGVTDYLIACPTEVMKYGFPYHLIGKHLTGQVDYEGVAEGFHEFYSNYSIPCGTIAVTDCSELEKLGEIMLEINQRFTFDISRLGEVQRMDGYSPIIFFDYGDYVAKLCDDASLLARFNEQLERAVPSRYKRHTPTYYSNALREVPIRAYSGTTVSDPSRHSVARLKTETAWYKDTH